SPGIAKATVKAQDGDNFGWAVAAGDFNGDHRDDLAVGIPGKDAQAGAIMILNGGPTGLVAASSKLIEQGVGGVSGSHQAGAAIGAPGEDIGTAADDGSVVIWHGVQDKGLTTAGSVFMYPGGKDMPAAAQGGAKFGCSLAIGDFNGDHLKGAGAGADQDLAVGA